MTYTLKDAVADAVATHRTLARISDSKTTLEELVLLTLKDVPVGVLLDELGHGFDNGYLSLSWEAVGVVACGISKRPSGDMKPVLVVKP